MKIIELRASNIKKLTTVAIQPDGNMVQITGRNGQGKSSVLDAIWWALEGSKNIQAKPIRDGEERAEVHLDLGDIKITRRFNAQEDGSYTTSITVENGEGARFSSPQSMLDALVGELAFDPLAFARSKPDDQVKALKALVDDFDFEANDREIKKAFDDRTDANRDAKRYRSTIDELSKKIPEGAPEKVESLSNLSADLQQAQEHNQRQRQRSEKIDRHKSEIARLQNDLDEAQKRVEQITTLIKANESDLSGTPEPEPIISTKEILERMEIAESAQGVAQAMKQRQTAISDAEEAEGEATFLTAEIERLRAKAKEAISKTKLPVEGLGINDGVVTLDNVPFNQASDAQQLRASVAIAMSMNPKLRVIRIRDGSLLDSDAMTALAQIADQEDFQIWIERVDSSGNVGFVLEDGHLKGQEPEQSAPQVDQGSSMFDVDQP